MAGPADMSELHAALDRLRPQLCHCGLKGECLGCKGIEMIRVQAEAVVAAAGFLGAGRGWLQNGMGPVLSCWMIACSCACVNCFFVTAASSSGVSLAMSRSRNCASVTGGFWAAAICDSVIPCARSAV